MLIKEIFQFEKKVKEGKWQIDRRERLFVGADLIFLPDTKRNKFKERKGSIIYTYTRFAREISSIVYEIKHIFADYLDSFDKYVFYSEFGERVNE